MPREPGRAGKRPEKRLALVIAWGANHDRGAVQRRRLQREGEQPVNITVPFFITHGAGDQQIPLEYAHHAAGPGKARG